MVISGPGILPLIFPEMPASSPKDWATLTSRLEVHAPNSPEDVEKFFNYITLDEGFYLEDTSCTPTFTPHKIHHQVRESQFTLYDDLDYPQFGRTLLTAYRFAKPSAAGTAASVHRCILFVGKLGSPLLSVVDQPITFLMNYISNGRLCILYPGLTVSKRGIRNSVVMPEESPISYVEEVLGRSGVAVRRSLLDWDEFAEHRCGQHINCPAHVREGRGFGQTSFLFDLGKDAHPSRDPTRYGDSAEPYISWRLRCSNSCFRQWKTTLNFGPWSTYQFARYKCDNEELVDDIEALDIDTAKWLEWQYDSSVEVGAQAMISGF
ncbi:hypothetical protein DFP72DRAFT_855242 [Ephemerocybe angulata]|uniref:Uncharacterized protein n=1 Tax=Ephemerocybe angulata TaxID=980116 RepID=A0A8H6HGP1_9AGAR|nr:hypothetical protein DFP72DRAFT_855242 [Tulosesus angulatus]